MSHPSDKETGNFDVLTKLNKAKEFKESGNDLYKSGDWRNAMRNYHK